MKISIDHDALQWFKEKHDESIWFIVRYKGNSSIRPGNFVGTVSEKLVNEIVSFEKDVLLFW